MRRSRSGVRSQLEMMEPRALLSILTPTPTARPMIGRVVDVSDVVTSRRAGILQDSVRIQNQTPYALEVTAVLGSSPIRRITETIPAERRPDEPSVRLFDFRSNNPSFISIDVKRKDGGRIPTPLANSPLNRPLNGYHGKLFAITVIGQSFSVSL
jgi:hypothetical protein